MPSAILLNLIKKIKKSDYLLLLLWLLACIIINPIGEFPINDDWAYSKNVYNLAVNHTFIVDQFPAMNLISQTIYGSVVVWIFGFSFLTLRLSILLLSICASVYFKKIIFQLSNNNEWLSFYIIPDSYLCRILNPLRFLLFQVWAYPYLNFQVLN